MICNPRTGQRVQLWYAEKWRGWARLHGAIGTVVIASHGRPRNHCVEVAGQRVVVPCGNLRKESPTK